jgi:hypothetical protein
MKDLKPPKMKDRGTLTQKYVQEHPEILARMAELANPVVTVEDWLGRNDIAQLDRIHDN